MPQIMSPRYSAPASHSSTDMNARPPSYYSAHPHQQRGSGLDDGERPSSYQNIPPLSHSMSTPSARDHEAFGQQSRHPSLQNAESDQSELSLAAAEKRRNKLGYHRTSVACGHCRRRKIRCIPSPTDVQGRCVNCIRLKKECSFFPVDQQPPIDPKQRSSSRTSTAPKLTSTSPPPAMRNGIALDSRGQQGYSQLPMPAVQPAVPSNKTSATESFVPAVYGTSGMTNWMSADASPSVTKPGDMSWRYPGESPTTPAIGAYTTYPGQPSEPSWSTSVSGEVPTREDMAWSGYEGPPIRSLSYSSDSMTSQQAPYSPYSGRPYAPSLAATIPGVDTVSSSMDHQMALSTGSVASPEYHTWPQYQYAKPGESYGQWYPEQRHAHSEDHPEEQPPQVPSMY